MMYRPVPEQQHVEGLKSHIEGLVQSALHAGFRGIDTAYARSRGNSEPGIGSALASLFASGVAREGVFIQAKVDPNYSEGRIKKQVKQSIADSLSNLNLEYLDCLLLHWPAAEHAQ